MTDLLDDERFWDGLAVLDAVTNETPNVPVASDGERPAWEREDDGYDYADGTA